MHKRSTHIVIFFISASVFHVSVFMQVAIRLVPSPSYYLV